MASLRFSGILSTLFRPEERSGGTEGRVTTLTYEVTEADFLDFQRHHFRNSRMYKGQLLRLRLMIVLMSAALLAGIFILYPGDVKYFVIGAVALATVFQITLLHRNIERRVLKSARALLHEGRTAGNLLGPKSIEFLDAELVEKSNRETSIIDYGAIERIEQSNDNLFLYLGALQAIIIPKRALREGEEATLREWLAQKGVGK